MAAYIVVEVTVEDPVIYEGYKRLVPPSVARYGGRFLVRGGATSTLEGGWAPERFVIVEFPSGDLARSWWSSPEYAEAKALRQRSSRTEMLLVEGVASAPA